MTDLTAPLPHAAHPPRQHWTIELAERGLVPDALLRLVMRRLLRARLREELVDDLEVSQRRLMLFIERMRRSPIAVDTAAANAQHYEVPAAFHRLCMGRHMKYSSCLFTTGSETLDEAEAAMLALTCERAELTDGQEILEIGCGWGSLSLWMAQRYPRSRIRAVSNSNSQREYIMDQARERGLSNLTVETADISTYQPPGSYDRVVSVECFEHLRNHADLFRRIAGWLKIDGKLFCHIFTHRTVAYTFDDRGDDDWMARHFFTGGMMPSDSLFTYYQDDLTLDEHWRVSGQHYARTARWWLCNLDAHHDQAVTLFAKDMLPAEAKRMVQRWRMFFMACEELWAFNRGNEWLVSHYRFTGAQRRR
ncbi:MAG: class I SAM-dependent methyltransferase [Planctomycetes bacterium]|nr:class I SAM-dependent methyltransferase [Planctomycetota bacterium]